jgi:hypothetical protein
MGFIKDKIIAPVAGQAAKHTSPDVGHKAVVAVGAHTVCEDVQQQQQGNRSCCACGRVPSAAHVASSSHWRTMHCWIMQQ